LGGLPISRHDLAQGPHRKPRLRVRRQSLRRAARFVRNYPTDLPVLADLLPQIQTPILVLASDHDPMVPVSNAEFLARRLPRSVLTILDAGHYAWEDAPDAYGDAAAAWLDGGFAKVGGA
jgi:pimeloyl-ACP methyl ester carboxylesterase